MKFLCLCLCAAAGAALAGAAPANGFVFPDDRRQQKKLEPIITPPVLPVLEHLERDPSTLLPRERVSGRPWGGGGLTASVSSSTSAAGASHSASQSFSFGFNQGFSASHSASQASSFNGFGNGFSGSQASSLAGAAAQAAAPGNHFGSQSASSAFGFNSLSGFPQPDSSFGNGFLDVRHRGVPKFPFPDLVGRSKGVGAAAFRTSKSSRLDSSPEDVLAILVSN